MSGSQFLIVAVGVGLFFAQQSLFVTTSREQYCEPNIDLSMYGKPVCYDANVTRRGFPISYMSRIEPVTPTRSVTPQNVPSSKTDELPNFVFWLLLPYLAFMIVRKIADRA